MNVFTFVPFSFHLYIFYTFILPFTHLSLKAINLKSNC